MIKSTNKKWLKEQLGACISATRRKKGYSQRELARRVEISNSNLKYIEDGVNSPSPIVYTKLMNELIPSFEEREEMDRLYSEIRGTPPPDICKFMIENSELYKIIRSDNKISEESKVNKIVNSINKDEV